MIEKSGTDLSVPGTTQIGLEPTASAVTGRRSNQLSHWALMNTYDSYKMDPRGLEPRTDRL